VNAGPGQAAHWGVVGAFARVVAETPERPAILFPGRRLTYGELDERSRSVASGLASHGVRPGNRVVLALPRGEDSIVAVLGIVRLGAVYVPVDPAWPESRLRSIFDQTSPAAIITGGSHKAFPASVTLRELGEADGANAIADYRSAPDDPIYIMFTSGTTGEPKGVVVPHRAVWRLVEDPDFMDTGSDRVWLQLAATSFDAATLEIWTPLVRGGGIAPVTEAMPSLDSIAAIIKQECVTDAWLTASLFNAFVDFRLDALTPMKQVLTGGERLSPEHVARFLDAHPGVRLINGYGPTENTTFTCCHTIAAADCEHPGGVPIGRPIRGTDVRIVGNDLRPVPEGEAGELVAGGEGVALGYLGDETLTSARFVTVPGDSGVWYRTGDLVRREAPEAEIEFLGRRDRQVKIRGHRVELEEVERVLRACDGVGQAYAFAIGSRADERSLVAAVVLNGGGAGGVAHAVREEASRMAPDYVVPDRIVVLDDVPIGPTGKADREAIEAQLRASGPSAGQAEVPVIRGTHGFIWNRLALLAAEVLNGVRPEPGDGFLALGGHSIDALRFAAAIESEFGARVGISEILRTERLGDLAGRIEEIAVTAEHRAIGAEAEGHGIDGPSRDLGPSSPPLASSIQRQFFFENAVDPTGIAYHEHAAFFVPGAQFSPDCMIRAFRALIRRHEALRTTLALEDAGLVQSIESVASAEHVAARVHESVRWEMGAHRAEVPAEPPPAVRGAIAVPFDLERDLPARLDIFPIVGGGHAVVLTFQHAAIDEWSLGIIEAELASLYADPDSPADIAPSYTLYSEREVSDADQAAIASIAERLMTAGEPRVDLARAPAEAAIEAGPWLDERALDEGAARLGVTPTAFAAGLYAWALGEAMGLARVALLTPISRRLDRSTQQVVGCCNLMRPFLVEVGSRRGGAIQAAILSARDALLEAYDAPPVPFERVAQEIRKRGGSDASVVPFGFANETRPPFQPFIEGAHSVPLPLRSRIARFRVGLSLDRRHGRLFVSLTGPQQGDTPAVLRAVRERMEAGLAQISDGARRTPASGAAAGVGHSDVSLRETEVETLAAVSPEDRSVAENAWRASLGVEPVGAGARFFEAGGHSLLLLRLSAMIRGETGLEIPLGSFLEQPDFDGLLGLMARRRAQPSSASGSFEIEELGEGDRVIIAIPGAFGRPLAFHELAKELAGRKAGIVLRSYNMFDAASNQEIPGAFDMVCRRLASDLVRPEVVGAIGYCAGGLYPLFLDSLPESATKRLHLWLVNVFAPNPPGSGRALRAQSLRDALLHVPGWPGACFAGAVTAARMASVRIRGRTRGVDGDLAWHLEFRRVIRCRAVRGWRGQATVFIAGRKPPWRDYYKNERLNGMTDFLSGPTRSVVMPVFHHELLARGAARIADEVLTDLGTSVGRHPG
jgi:amino acid adenylation domain-containing protein